MYRRRNLLGEAVWAGLGALLPGCASLERGAAVPKAQTLQASVLGLPNERFFPAYQSEAIEMEFRSAVQRRRRTLHPLEAAGRPASQQLPQGAYLAVSGGGEDGA